MDAYKKTQKNKSEARSQVREDVFKWYLAMSGGVLPKQQCEDTKAHDSIRIWWLEPLIPGVDNPLVVEQEKLSGSWTIRIDPIQPKIQVFLP